MNPGRRSDPYREVREIGLDLARGILALSQEAMIRAAEGDSVNDTADPTATPPAAPDQETLAKKTRNPVADLISIPLHGNFTFGTGPSDGVLRVLDIQAVISIGPNEEWNIITRTILPVIHQPGLTDGGWSDSGIGDLPFRAFLSPAGSEGLT